MRRQPGTGEQLPHARLHPSAELVPNNATQSAAIAVLAALPDPVVVLNRRGLITGWNPAAEELFGYSNDEVLGRPWTEFVVADGGLNGSAQSQLDAIGSTVQRGGTWEGSFPITTRDGDSLLARVRAAPMTAGGLITGTVVTAIDLFGTDASRDDQQRAAARAAVRAAVLSRAGMQLGTSLDTGRTLAALAEILVPAFADTCVVDLLDENGVAQRLVTVHSTDIAPCPPMRAGTEIHYPARHPCDRALRTGRPVLIQGAPRVKALDPDEECDRKALLLDAKSLIAVPLLAPSGVRGVLAIALTEDAEPTPRYDTADLELVEELAARAGLALENAAMFDRQRTLALALQKSLLPTDLPLPDGVSIRVGYAPGAASEVSGDLYDVVELSAGRIGVVIGDVQGRGAHAAAVMGQLRAALRAYAVLDVQPGQLLSYLDELVRGLNEEILVTCVYAIYDPFTRRCALANAGHPPPLLASAHGTYPMEVPPDVPLGIGPLGPGGGKGAVQFDDHIFSIPPGDVLVMYTDGVVERRDQSVDQGVRTLCEAIERVVREPRAICRAALRAAGSEAHDDQAVLAMATSTVDLPLSRLALPARPEAAFAARHHTRAVLREWGLSEHAELAELLVSELITNAVRHASGPRPSPWSFTDADEPAPAAPPLAEDMLELAAVREYASHLGALDEDNEMDLLAEPGLLDELGMLDGTLTAPGGSRRLDLVLRRGLRALWIEVHDPDVRLPRIRQAAETDEGGRGLYLVDALSARWGARPTDAGKFVWFELPLF
ncbi:MAG: SpoIIE family protein phosphatase [Catenulispora sp.]|nr:SpoIIE family protein phosphatase [Catenulispora sp.]